MPVTLRANCIGSLAAQALTTGNIEIVGQVVNTFPNSFYVKTLNGELLFVTNRPLKSPITVNIDDTSDLDRLVKPMDHVSLLEGQVHAGQASIDLRKASSYRSESSPASWLSSGFTKTADYLGISSFLLGIVDTSQSVLDARGLAHEGIANFVSDGVLPFRLSEMEGKFREAAYEIVGLGCGFTPSGDDLLGGFLAAYNYLAPALGRLSVLLDFTILRERTSWISAKLLDYMQRLILDEQVRSLLASAARGDVDAVVLALETLLPRGHTSGVDISIGATLAFSLIRDLALDERETENIASQLGLML